MQKNQWISIHVSFFLLSCPPLGQSIVIWRLQYWYTVKLWPRILIMIPILHKFRSFYLAELDWARTSICKIGHVIWGPCYVAQFCWQKQLQSSVHLIFNRIKLSPGDRQTLGHVYIIKGIAKWSRLLIGGHWPLHLRTWYMYILEFRIERHRGLRDLTKTLQTKDESTLQMVHFYSKKVMYNKYHGMQEMKFLMILFDNLNHKQKVLECA